MTEIKGEEEEEEERRSFASQSIGAVSTLFGRSYLLGNRKGLAGLETKREFRKKQKKQKQIQVYILKREHPPSPSRYAKSLKQEGVCVPPSPTFT